MNTAKKLSKVFKNSKEILFNKNSKIIIMSDCHRGDGSWSDDFLRNKNIFYSALSYYYNEGYTYIELGDGDELWENKKLKDIIVQHSDIFKLMAKFHEKKRLYMLYGNHDICKKKCQKTKKEYLEFFDELIRKKVPLFKDIEIYEGLILKSQETGNKIFLVHGHQGDLINDQLWQLGRFLVRYFWRPLQIIGINDPTNPAKNYKKKDNLEKNLIKWTKGNNQMLIAGHTHRPAFPKIGDALYFNDGSILHPSSISGLEIEKGEIKLIKWSIKSGQNGSLYVGKDKIEGPVKLEKYFNKN